MTTVLSWGPAFRAELRMVLVPLMAACRTGSGSVKKNETGEARWAIAVTSICRVSGEFYTDCLDSAN
jgi:hypothetical protein